MDMEEAKVAPHGCGQVAREKKNKELQSKKLFELMILRTVALSIAWILDGGARCGVAEVVG